MEQRPSEPMRERDHPVAREPRSDRMEPVADRTDGVREQRTGPVRDRAGRDEMWPDMADFRRRFDEAQVQFVEEPQAAVKKAEELLKEAVDRMATTMHERLGRIHGEMGDGGADTERLRLAMQRLRRMIDSFEGRAA